MPIAYSNDPPFLVALDTLGTNPGVADCLTLKKEQVVACGILSRIISSYHSRDAEAQSIRMAPSPSEGHKSRLGEIGHCSEHGVLTVQNLLLLAVAVGFSNNTLQ